jgi:hypothetical protein
MEPFKPSPCPQWRKDCLPIEAPTASICYDDTSGAWNFIANSPTCTLKRMSCCCCWRSCMDTRADKHLAQSASFGAEGILSIALFCSCNCWLRSSTVSIVHRGSSYYTYRFLRMVHFEGKLRPKSNILYRPKPNFRPPIPWGSPTSTWSVL